MGVEPHIGKDRPTFIYHFPATVAIFFSIGDIAQIQLRRDFAQLRFIGRERVNIQVPAGGKPLLSAGVPASSGY
jgi:hypothetical protein